MYTDNNPLTYVKGNKLGAAQIQWLSELALFDLILNTELVSQTRQQTL